MITILIISALFFYVIYLLKNSNSDFFYQNTEILNKKNWLIGALLDDYNFSFNRKTEIQKAFKFFCKNAKEFDGATIVKDITQINNLDIPAMAHDYAYINAKNIKDRLKADWLYSQDYRQFEVPWTIAYSRMALLFFINITGIYNLKQLFVK